MHVPLLFAALDMTVQEVSKLMDSKGVSSVVIDHGYKVSIVSIEDLLRHLNLGGSGNDKLDSLPEHRLSFIDENENVLDALERLNENGDRYLAVRKDDQQLLGIITYTDLLSACNPSVLIESKTLGELISPRVPVTFSPDWILEDVLCHFSKLEDSIVVVEDNTPIGIITTKDVFRILASGSPVNRQVSEFMTSPVVTAYSSWTVSGAFEQLKKHRIKRLIVVNDAGRLVGVITQSELVGFAYGSWIALSKNNSDGLRELVSVLDRSPVDLDVTAMTDSSTKLGNRQMLQIKISQEIERIRRYHFQGFCLLRVSITVPSTAQADPNLHAGIINTLASELLRVIRSMDSLCLWDDNNFGLLLPHTSAEQAGCLVVRIQQKLFDLSLLEQDEYRIGLQPYAYDSLESDSDFMARVAADIAAGRQ